MVSKTSENRRKYIRFDINTKVNVKIKEAGPTQSMQAVSKNASVEGICFRCETKLEPGKRTELEIFLSESEPVHIQGEVRWSNPVKTEDGKTMFDTGVKLFTINKSDENRFLAYVCENMAERLCRYLHL